MLLWGYRALAGLTTESLGASPSGLGTRLKPAALKQHLDELFERYHRRELIHSDPLEFVYDFAAPEDRETIAIVSALLAYGNVTQIKSSVRSFVDRARQAGLSPAEAARAAAGHGAPRLRSALRGWVHRFNPADDLQRLLRAIGLTQRSYGSVGAFMSSLARESRPELEPDVSAPIDRLVAEWRREMGPSFFLTSPSSGSVCKRWMMLLRWMVRNDEIDPGLWSQLPQAYSPRQLLIPLDTHTGRISQKLGLTRRKSLGFEAVLEVTQSLRRFDAEDPVRYDFALCRVGILSNSKLFRNSKYGTHESSL